MAALDRGEYLAAIQGLRDGAVGPDGEVRDRALLQIWRQARVFAGVDGICSMAPDSRTGGTPLDPTWTARLSQASRTDAIAEIVKRARKARVVILNESHQTSRGRAFGLELARALRPLGYSLLAVEALSNRRGAPLLAGNAVPLDAGFYTKDPVFADMIVQAIRIGYRVSAYEHVAQTGPAGPPVDREQGQAQNLSSLMSHDPRSKLLVFVGHSHVAESPLPGRGGAATEWMAARLKRISGVDPLTIDQASLNETSANRSARDAHRIASRGLRTRSAILFEQGSPLVYGQYGGAVDLQVVHPRTRCISGRPDWLTGMERRPTAIPRHLLPRSGRRLVQAFAKNAPSNAVPLDQVIVEAGRRPGSLMLPDQPVRYEVQN
ncbi:MAG TPA: hypothetical protein VFZ91_12980 [Allosphingosinicella sp.]